MNLRSILIPLLATTFSACAMADGDIGQSVSQCGGEGVERLKKRVAVTGFPTLYPDQAKAGRIGDAGEMLPQLLQQQLVAGGGLQVFGATRSRMFIDLQNAPTVQQGDNRLTNVLDLAREMDVQFVLTGVIRDLGVADPSAWGTSVLDGMQRGMGLADQRRRFAADLMIFDGFSGSPIHHQRFKTTADWGADPGRLEGFGSVGFQQTAYGRSVKGVIREMARAVTAILACQPFITRIARVDGFSVTLESGAMAGLRAGDELTIYRSKRYLEWPGEPPELQDSNLSVTLYKVQPHVSVGTIPRIGAIENIQRGDVAISR